MTPLAGRFLDLAWTVLCAGTVRGLLVFLFAAALTSASRRLAAEYGRVIWFLVILCGLIIPFVWLFLLRSAAVRHYLHHRTVRGR